MRLVGSAAKSGPCRPFTSGPERGRPSRRASVPLPRPGTPACPDQWVSRALRADQERANVAGPGPQAVLALKRPHARRLGLFCERSLNPSRGLCASLAQRARGECEHRQRGGGGLGRRGLATGGLTSRRRLQCPNGGSRWVGERGRSAPRSPPPLLATIRRAEMHYRRLYKSSLRGIRAPAFLLSAARSWVGGLLPRGLNFRVRTRWLRPPLGARFSGGHFCARNTSRSEWTRDR